MAAVLFVLGLPGSGKSRLVRYIVELLERFQLKMSLHNDFEILKEMFEHDSDKQFKKIDDIEVVDNSALVNGFDVIDFKAFDIALKRLGDTLGAYIRSEAEKELVIIEFSRNDYKYAFSLLKDQDFLRDAYFLHLDTDVNICKERVRNRSANPVYKDDFPVSKFIFDHYYYKDDGGKLPAILRKYYVDESRVLTLQNNGTFEAISPQIERFVDFVCIESSLVVPIAAKR